MLDIASIRTHAARFLVGSAVSVLAAAVLAVPASAGDRSVDGSHQLRAAVKLHATLTGAREVPGPGDPNGRGRVTITLRPAAGKVCAHATWRRIGAPVTAHIHKGGPSVAGDVVVDLTGAVTDGSNCATGVARTLIRRLDAHPRRFYFNIHTIAYPAGAIRGQLHH
jgi:hypothetical protein